MKAKNKLQNLLPKNKFDNKNIIELSNIGFPGLNPILPDLLIWIQDMNWPVANPICQILSNAGYEIIPEIIKILNTDDHEWIYFIITSLLPNLKHALQNEIIKEVINYSKKDIAIEYKEIAYEYIEKYNKFNSYD